MKPLPSTSPEAFKSWVRVAQTGEQYVYHVGLLARDRFDNGNESKPKEPLHDLGRAALLAQDAGLVLLTQRRRDTISFYYIATRTAQRIAHG